MLVTRSSVLVVGMVAFTVPGMADHVKRLKD